MIIDILRTVMSETRAATALDARFQALSDAKRLRILELLCGGEECVCDLTEAMDVSQSLLSFHLAKLKEAGLVRDRRQGRWAYYSLDPTGLAELRDRLEELASAAGEDAAYAMERCC